MALVKNIKIIEICGPPNKLPIPLTKPPTEAFGDSTIVQQTCQSWSSSRGYVGIFLAGATVRFWARDPGQVTILHRWSLRQTTELQESGDWIKIQTWSWFNQLNYTASFPTSPKRILIATKAHGNGFESARCRNSSYQLKVAWAINQ